MLFKKLQKSRAPRQIQLPDGYFKEDSESALPGTKVGVRRLSAMELEYCREEAKGYEEQGFGSYDNSMLVNVVAMSLTMPDDVSKPFLKAGDIEARSVFTPQGLEYLYDVVLQLHLSTTPIYEEIADENIDRLITLLKTKKLSKKLKRLLSYVLDELCLL